MTTVLSVGRHLEYRCDARCHEARSPACDCVCRGRYHGRGTAQAIAQVQQDVATGVFGEVVMVDGRRQLEHAKREHPNIVRYHEREVRHALGRPDQPRLPIEASS